MIDLLIIGGCTWRVYLCLADSALPSTGETLHDLMDHKHLRSLLKRRTK